MRRWFLALMPALTCTGIYLQSDAALAGDRTTDSVRAAVNDLMKRAVLHFKTSTLSSQDSALLLSDSAEAQARRYLGEYDSTSATALALMAFGAINVLNYYRADTLARQSIQIWQALRGKNCPQQAYPLRMLSTALSGQNRRVEAEKAQKLAIELLRAAPDYQGYTGVFRMPHFLALLINNYGNYFLGQGNLDEAERLYKEAGTIWTNAYGAESPEAAVTTFNLARIARARGNLVTAETLARKALRVYEQTPVEKKIWPTDVAETYVLLAKVCSDLGKWEEANTLTDLAIAGYNEAYGGGTPGSLIGIQNAIQIAASQRYWARAAKYAEEEMQVLEKYDIQSAATQSTVYLELARFYYSLGALTKSLAAFDRSVALRQSCIKSAFAFASERNKLDYLRQFPLIYQSLLTFAVSDPRGRVVPLALGMVLGSKGAVLDALSQERSVALCSERTDLQTLVASHATVCDSIANLAFRIPGFGDPVLIDRAKRLYATKDSLELTLSSQCSEFAKSLHFDTVTSALVAAALPPKSVLWEFMRYQPYNFNDPDSVALSRYLAFALDNQGRTTVSDLGDAHTIDSLVDLVHQQIWAGVEVFMGSDERDLEKKLAGVTGQLYQLVLAPLEGSATGAEHIFISPDGQLSLLPFEILPLPDGRYAIEKYEFSYLSTGRDLLQYQSAPRRETTGAVVVAAPDFEIAGSGVYAGIPEDIDQPGTSRFRGPSDRTECLAVPFNPLPGSAVEGQTVADMLRNRLRSEVSYLSGTEASEASLKHLTHAPRVLHLATHGYFCSKASYSDVSRMTESPLLYSGLALAGSNRTIEDPNNTAKMTEDGILTALEVSGLNLMGTDLVVLGSCRAGVGPVLQGEGVYGLRRAFQLAGARSVIMTMFDVPDMTARDLVTRFYTNWLSGTTKSKALRNAVLAELRQRRQQRGAAHPLFWGGFILAGNPN